MKRRFLIPVLMLLIGFPMLAGDSLAEQTKRLQRVLWSNEKQFHLTDTTQHMRKR